MNTKQVVAEQFRRLNTARIAEANAWGRMNTLRQELKEAERIHIAAQDELRSAEGDHYYAKEGMIPLPDGAWLSRVYAKEHPEVLAQLGVFDWEFEEGEVDGHE